MGLTAVAIEGHIRHWEEELKRRAHPHRAKWPSRLFHHAPLENAVGILATGELRARADPANAVARDVAAAGVIDNRAEAHRYARLYFRPRTPTQYRIEGIRKPDECAYGADAHAPVLIMFLFDARAVLGQPDIRFSDQNMQSAGAVVGNCDEDFGRIPFEKVYHLGGIAGDYSIISHRCAEVLAASPLHLEHTLLEICCRSTAERDTLLFLLGADAARWQDRIIVSDDLRVFEKSYPFAQEVYLTPTGIVFKLNPRFDGRTVDVGLRTWDAHGSLVEDFRNEQIQTRPPGGDRWRVPCQLAPGRYRVQLTVDSHLAFEAELHLEDSLM